MDTTDLLLAVVALLIIAIGYCLYASSQEKKKKSSFTDEGEYFTMLQADPTRNYQNRLFDATGNLHRNFDYEEVRRMYGPKSITDYNKQVDYDTHLITDGAMGGNTAGPETKTTFPERTQFPTIFNPEGLLEKEYLDGAADKAAQHVEHFANAVGMSGVGGPQDDYDGQDYADMLQATLDPKIKQSHYQFVEEIAPYSATARNVDDFDQEPYNKFLGLRRIQPVAQSSAKLFVTEQDGSTFAKNPKFNFK